MLKRLLSWWPAAAATLLLAAVLGGGSWTWPWPKPAVRWPSAAALEADLAAAALPAERAQAQPSPFEMTPAEVADLLKRKKQTPVESFTIDGQRVQVGMTDAALYAAIPLQRVAGQLVSGNAKDVRRLTVTRLYRSGADRHVVVLALSDTGKAFRITAIAKLAP